MNARISWNFISINNITDKMFYYSDEWTYLSANENYFKYYSFPFPRFHRFSFHSFLWVWLISKQIRNFGGFYEIKVDIQIKTRAIITFTSTMKINVYSPLFSTESHFEQIHMFLLSNTFISPLLRANNYFSYKKPLWGVLKG